MKVWVVSGSAKKIQQVKGRSVRRRAAAWVAGLGNHLLENLIACSRDSCVVIKSNPCVLALLLIRALSFNKGIYS